MEVPAQADVLFVSHLLNTSQVGSTEDFYYGRLPELLGRDGISSCVLLLNQTGRPRGTIGTWSPDMAPRVILPDTLALSEELALRRRLRREARRLRKAAVEGANTRRQRIVEEAACQALSGSSLASLRIHEQVLNLAKQLRPKAIVVTYEGHAWERMAFAAARLGAPGVRCIGYHHTILFPRQHALLRLLSNRLCDPDVVLTAGDISRDRFRKAHWRVPIDVATMGTHRRQAIAAQSEQSSVNRTSGCLIIPDGIISEVVFLLDFAIKAAHLARDIRFVLRLHPVVSLATLMRRFPRFQRLPPNVEFSTLSLADDFARTRWALYRGTNAAIYAVIAGLRPCYVEKPAEMTIDPLNDLVVWKRVVREPDQFVEHARSDLREGSPRDSAEAATALEYCQRYFMPADYGVFTDALGGGRTSHR